MTEANIIGWGHTKFGRLDGKTLEDLIIEAGKESIAHAGIDPADIDAIWVGNFNNGMVPDGFTSSLALQIDPALRFRPSVRVENACASGSAAIYAARDAIRSRRIKTALVIGVEKMTNKNTEGVTEALAGASYQKEESGLSFPQVFAQFAATYFAAYGDHSHALAQIAAKNHANAMANPLAHLHKALDVEFCNTISDRNPLIAPPLRMSDCSLISDGAAAIIMSSDDIASNFQDAVTFRSAEHINDYLPMSQRNLLDFEGPATAFQRSFKAAGITVHDLDFAEVHDCFTIAELLIYEAMGLAPKGRGQAALDEGIVQSNGRLPINLSGGLKAKGHPVGATGVSMHVMAARQLTGQAQAMQKQNAQLGCVFNMGGSGVANYCSVLERKSR